MTISPGKPVDIQSVKREPAILLKQIYPPTKKDLSGSTYLGGVPRLPEQLSWPCLPSGSGVALHFLAQIDCNALPKSVEIDGIDQPIEGAPDKGVLYFFIAGDIDELGWSGLDGIRVLYWPNGLEGVAERSIPEHLPELGEYCCLYSHSVWRDKPENVRGFQTLPKVPLQPLAYPSICFEKAVGLALAMDASRDLDDAEDTLDILHRLQTKTLDEALQMQVYASSPGLSWPWVSDFELPSNRYQSGLPKAVVPEDFPWRWLMVSRIALAVRLGAVEKIARRDRDEFDIVLLKAWPRVVAEAEQWMARSEEKGPFEKIDTENSREFREWIRALLDVQHLESSAGLIAKFFNIGKAAKKQNIGRMITITHMMEIALREGFFAAWPYIAATGDLSDIDPDFLASLAPNHQPRNCGDGDVHQLLGAPNSLQHELPGIHDKKKLLLQVASDHGADMIWGDVAMLQFWIDEEDLQACNFANVRCTVEGHLNEI